MRHNAGVAGSTLKGLQLEIAVVLSTRPRTLYETATAVGRKSGDIQRTLRKMHEEGWVAADAAEPVQGTQYWLHPDRRHEFEAALETAQLPGLLVEGQRILEIAAVDLGAIYEVLERVELSAPIAWLIELDGSNRRLLGLHGDTSMLQAQRLQAALQAAGIECRPGRVGARIDGRTLREHAAGVLEAARVKTG
jgi:hypothetical protein